MEKKLKDIFYFWEKFREKIRGGEKYYSDWKRDARIKYADGLS